MEKAENIQKQIRALFASQNLAVLATHNQDQPYAYDRDGLVALLDELMSQDKSESE